MSRMSADANFFPASLPSEGMQDVVCIDASLPRMAALKMMTDALDGSHFSHDCVEYQKVVAYRLIPHERSNKEGYISIDGETLKFAPFQAESHRGLGMTLSKDGKFTGGAP